MEEIITKEELKKIDSEILDLKLKFQSAVLRKDYKTANICVDKIGKLVKRVKKYQKYLKKKGDVVET